MSLRIKYINHGIASRVGNTIYINKRLKQYPELHYQIVQHEKSHSSGFNKKDILLDLGIEELSGHKKEYYKFILTNPSSWTEYLPFVFIKKKLFFNPIMIFLWCVGIIFGMGIYKFLN